VPPRAVALPAEYVTQATIAASPDLVWRILTDPAGYAWWNPEILGVDGRFGIGERIAVKVRIPSGAVRSVSLRITAFEPVRQMEWTGGLPFGLFVGKRTISVYPNGDGTRFRMHLSMTGPLAPLIRKSVGDRQADIDSFSKALKTHAEQQ
jgi:uncharacterized protein YndB with AHSA1/START domain